MTSIDFYILGDRQQDAAALFSCKLAEKAWRQGHRVYIHCESPLQLQQLDDMLWSFRPGSFIPHGIYGETAADDCPVLLGHAVDPAECHDVLVNLAGEVPAWFSRFERVAEPVDGADDRRAAARQRYRFYQERGYEMRSHNL